MFRSPFVGEAHPADDDEDAWLGGMESGKRWHRVWMQKSCGGRLSPALMTMRRPGDSVQEIAAAAIAAMPRRYRDNLARVEIGEIRRGEEEVTVRMWLALPLGVAPSTIDPEPQS